MRNKEDLRSNTNTVAHGTSGVHLQVCEVEEIVDLRLRGLRTRAHEHEAVRLTVHVLRHFLTCAHGAHSVQLESYHVPCK